MEKLKEKLQKARSNIKCLEQKVRRLNTRIDKTVMYYARKEQESILRVKSEKAAADIEACIEVLVNKGEGLSGEDMDGHLPTALALYYRSEAYKHLLNKFQKKGPRPGIVSGDAVPHAAGPAVEEGREAPAPRT